MQSVQPVLSPFFRGIPIVYSLENFLMKKFHIHGHTLAVSLLAAIAAALFQRHFHQQHVCVSNFLFSLVLRCSCVPLLVDIWIVLEFDWHTSAMKFCKQAFL